MLHARLGLDFSFNRTRAIAAIFDTGLNAIFMAQLEHLFDRLLHPGLGMDDVISDHDKLYIKTKRGLGRQLQPHVRLSYELSFNFKIKFGLNIVVDSVFAVLHQDGLQL